MNKNKIILDLCGGTGAWSKPYKDAGYDVRVITLPLHDIKTYTPPKNVYGILAAPPCTMFSMARTVAKTPRDLQGAMETVYHCLRIIWECQYNGSRLAFWAMENPKGRLRWFMGAPALTFSPSDFGDPYRKITDVWGNFNVALKHKPIKVKNEKVFLAGSADGALLRKLKPIPVGYIQDPNMSARSTARSITPQGFAQAFFKANL